MVARGFASEIFQPPGAWELGHRFQRQRQTNVWQRITSPSRGDKATKRRLRGRPQALLPRATSRRVHPNTRPARGALQVVARVNDLPLSIALPQLILGIFVGDAGAVAAPAHHYIAAVGGDGHIGNPGPLELLQHCFHTRIVVHRTPLSAGHSHRTRASNFPLPVGGQVRRGSSTVLSPSNFKPFQALNLGVELSLPKFDGSVRRF